MQKNPATSSPSFTGPTDHAQQISGQQSYSPSKPDDVERIRQRLQEYREHHKDLSARYEKNQPIFDHQIHEETVSYLKSGLANRNKKSQKPRAPKKAKATTSIPMAPMPTKSTISSDMNTQPNYSGEYGLVQPNYGHHTYQQTNNHWGHYGNQQSNYGFYHQNHLSLPNDLNFNIQSGLECDVDLIINHELSREGQLNFNQDLLFRLDKAK